MEDAGKGGEEIDNVERGRWEGRGGDKQDGRKDAGKGEEEINKVDRMMLGRKKR